MPTTYRIVPVGKRVDVDLARFQASLTTGMIVSERPDGIYVEVPSNQDEDAGTQPQVDRELDRIYFLTGVRLLAEMCSRRVTVSLSAGYRIHGTIPEGTGPVQWTDRLTLQFRLWQLASESTDVLTKIVLYFQIIEIQYPDTGNTVAYPRYTDERIPPAPRTEAKLLRHVVAHSGDPRTETSLYLKFLDLPQNLSNLIHPDWLRRITSRVAVVAAEAQAVLRSAAC